MPPKSTDTVDWLYNLGFHDALNYFEKKGLSKFKNKIRSKDKISYKHIDKIPHPYDHRKQVTMHRFLGYDLAKLTHEYVSFTLDFFLLVLLLVVWRPLVLLLIYCELILRLVVLIIRTITNEVVLMIPLNLLSFVIYQNIYITCFICFILCLEKALLTGLSASSQKNIKSCYSSFLIQILLVIIQH